MKNEKCNYRAKKRGEILTFANGNTLHFSSHEKCNEKVSKLHFSDRIVARTEPLEWQSFSYSKQDKLWDAYQLEIAKSIANIFGISMQELGLPNDE